MIPFIWETKHVGEGVDFGGFGVDSNGQALHHQSAPSVALLMRSNAPVAPGGAPEVVAPGGCAPVNEQLEHLGGVCNQSCRSLDIALDKGGRAKKLSRCPVVCPLITACRSVVCWHQRKSKKTHSNVAVELS